MPVQFKVGAQGAYLRQEVASGQSFLGRRTSSAGGRDNPTASDTIVQTYAQNPADGEGLFEFEPFLRRTDQSVFVTHVRIRVGPGAGPGIAWSVAITDGDEGVGSPDVDDPSRDVIVDSGTGDAVVTLNIDLPPKSKIRVITGAVSASLGIVQVEFFPTLDKFERIIN